MSGITDLKATREILRELARIVKSTRQTLVTMIEGSGWPGRLSSRRRSGQLADTLQHLGEVREGFILSQRASPHISLSELRALVQHILLDWNWLRSMNLALIPGSSIETVGPQLVVYNHALVALGILPHLPPEAITFPQQRPTYADLAVPTLPSEMLERIEELERVIYQAEVMPTQPPAYAPFRRTYAFFEASAWLVNRYLKTLLDD
jgi:hypothetical protein